MGTSDSTQGSAGGMSVTKYPVTLTFGVLVLAALAVLVLLRHLFGTIRVEAGTR